MPRFLATALISGLVLLLGACTPTTTSGSAAPSPAPVQPVPGRPVSKTIRLSQEANGAVVDLRVGDTLDLSLPGNPSTGFSWSPDVPLVGSVLEPLGSPGFRPSGTGLGAGGEVTLRYRAATPGQFRLSLSYGRPFAALPPNPQTFAVFLFVR